MKTSGGKPVYLEMWLKISDIYDVSMRLDSNIATRQPYSVSRQYRPGKKIANSQEVVLFLKYLPI
jgi:hypothetical protein